MNTYFQLIQRFKRQVFSFSANGPRWRGLLLGLFLPAALLPQLGSAQNYYQADIRDYNLTVTVPNTIVNTGDTVTVIVSIGKINQPIQNVVGFRLYFDLSSNAQKLSTLLPNMQNSWVFQTGISISESIGGSNNERYTYFYQRLGKMDGEGEILRLKMVAAHNGVTAASLLLSSGGVLIQETIAVRGTPSMKTEETLQVWPNPSAGTYYLYTENGEISNVQVYSTTGQILRSLGKVDEVDMREFAPGTYFLRVSTSEGITFNRILQKI